MWLSLARAPGLGPGSRRFESCHPDYHICASGSVGGARPCQGRGRGFESRLALFLYTKGILKGYLLYINESCRTRTVRIFVLLRSVLTEVHWTSSTPSRAMKDSAGLERFVSSFYFGRRRTDIHRMSCAPSRAMKDSVGLERSRSPLCSGRCRDRIVVFYSFIRDEGVAGAFFSVTSQHTGHWPGLF